MSCLRPSGSPATLTAFVSSALSKASNTAQIFCEERLTDDEPCAELLEGGLLGAALGLTALLPDVTEAEADVGR